MAWRDPIGRIAWRAIGAPTWNGGTLDVSELYGDVTTAQLDTRMVYQNSELK